VNISGTDTDIDKRKTALATTIVPTFGGKNDELWSTNNKLHVANVYPPIISSVRKFGQLYSSMANNSGTDQAIDKRKTALSTKIHSTFDEKNWLNFGPLTKKFKQLMFTHPKINTAHGA